MKIELHTCGGIREVWEIPDKDLNHGIDAAFDFETRYKLRKEKVNYWVKRMQNFYKDILDSMGCDMEIVLVFQSKADPSSIDEDAASSSIRD